MSGIASVRKALEVKLAAMSPALATQWENTKYTPTEGTAYQKVDFLSAEPFNPEIGGSIQDNGYMQVSLFYPIGTGAALAQARAQAIREFFPKGLNLTADGVNVLITRTPYIAQGASDGNRYAVNVKIRFFANNAT